MIKRLYLKELLSFEEVELEFSSGLVVLSGPSGAGKSLFMQALLANVGIGSSEAKLCEVELSKPNSMDSEELLLEDPLIVRALRKERSRYYINGQQISRKRLKELFEPYCSYLSVRDRGGFESEQLLSLLDSVAISEDLEAKKLYEEYKQHYQVYKEYQDRLKELEEEKRYLVEKKEFIRFEIDKIKDIDPKEGEYEELLLIKQRLSRLDRLQEALKKASMIFDLEESVQEVFDLMQKDSDYFTEAMNRLRADFEDTETLSEELAEVNIEEVLNRLESLSSLINRYGSIEKVLEYRSAKEAELLSYEHIDKNFNEISSFIKKEQVLLQELAGKITKFRQISAKILEDRLYPILESLKLPKLSFDFEEVELYHLGVQKANLLLDGSTTTTLSGGEFNRLRLALMSVALSNDDLSRGIVFLDEIDANVSGDESIAIAKMIEELAKRYQVFAISHQPHLSARANQHILIHKEGDRSIARDLTESERLKELARIVAGEEADKEVLSFVQKLRLTDTKKRRY